MSYIFSFFFSIICLVNFNGVILRDVEHHQLILKFNLVYDVEDLVCMRRKGHEVLRWKFLLFHDDIYCVVIEGYLYIIWYHHTTIENPIPKLHPNCFHYIPSLEYCKQYSVSIIVDNAQHKQPFIAINQSSCCKKEETSVTH